MIAAAKTGVFLVYWEILVTWKEAEEGSPKMTSTVLCPQRASQQVPPYVACVVLIRTDLSVTTTIVQGGKVVLSFV